MNRKEALTIGTDRLERAGVACAAIDARYLLEWAADMTMTEYALDPLAQLTAKQEKDYLDAIEVRGSRVPLQHITGEQEFMGIPFLVNGDVLIPRQDTELLVEEGLKRLQPGMRVLDLCTGSGCVILSMEVLGRHQNRADDTNQFTGSDVSGKALACARANQQRTGAEVSFVESDLFDHLPGMYDMILSNPPYIPTAVIEELEEEVRCHDPRLALDGHEDGLYFYRRIIGESRAHLCDGGVLLLEIGYDQRQDVTELLEDAGYRNIEAKKDLAGLDRVVIGRYDSRDR